MQEAEAKAKAVKENKMPENLVKQMILNDETLDGATKQRLVGGLADAKKEGYTGEAYIKPFDEVKKEKEAQGIYTIPKSVYYQMVSEDTAWFHTKRFHLYDDIDGAKKVVHYEYKDTNGMIAKTGDGQSVVHHRTGDRNIVLEATKAHGKARQEIAKIKADYEVRGKQFHDFMKPKESKDS